MNKNLIKISVLNLNKVPYIKDELSEKDKYKLRYYFLKLGFNVDEIKGNKKHIKKVIKVLANIRGLDNNWENTLLTFDEVKDNEDIVRLKTLFHYISVYGKDIFNINETYFPNDMSEEDKTKYSNIKKLLEDCNFTDNIIDIKFEDYNNIKEELKYFYEKYARPLSELDIEVIKSEKINIDINKMVFKENQIKLLENGFRVSNPELSIRFIKYILDLSPNMLYTKEVKLLQSSYIEDNLKEMCRNVIDNEVENNLKDFLKLLKQKRKLVKKLLATIEYEKSNLFEKIQYFLRQNKRIQQVKTKYSKVLNDKDVNNKDSLSIMRDKFLEYFRVYNIDNIITNFYKLSLKNQIQLLNYIRKTLLKHDLNKVGFKYSETYVLPHSSFTKEKGNDVINENEYKSLVKLNSIMTEIINKNILSIFSKNNTFISSNLLENLENKDIKFPISLRLNENSTFYYELGSSIKFDNSKNLRVGIYWENGKYPQVDLDLSVIAYGNNIKTKIGWNGKYSDEGIIFSGDVTNAPNGASEFIDINSKNPYNFLELVVNQYSSFSDKFYVGIMTDIDMINHKVNNATSYFVPEKVNIGYENSFSNENQLVIGYIDLERGLLYPTNIKSNNRISTVNNINNSIVLNTNKLSIKEIIDETIIYKPNNKTTILDDDINIITDINSLINFLSTNLY